MDQIEVLRRVGGFAGWPANYGAWAWGDEVVLTVALGTLDSGSPHGLHARDERCPFEPVQMRSRDGGRRWAEERFTGRIPGGVASLSADEHVVEELRIGPRLKPGEFESLADPIDFLDPETTVMCARTGLRAGSTSWFYVSRDRCRSWQGPHLLPDLGGRGVAARTDIVALGRQEALWMLTVPDEEGEGGVICARTTDGGRTFERYSIVAEAEGDDFAIMPSTVRTDDGLLSVIRRRHRLDAAISVDGGRSWELVSGIAETGPYGNPPSLVALGDGRVAVVYGRRSAPRGIRVRVGADGGRVWGQETTLREVMGSDDFGYPRTVSLGAGWLTFFYLNDAEDGERYIAATSWTTADLEPSRKAGDA